MERRTEEEENELWTGSAHVEPENGYANWERIAQRDRQLRGAIVLQRSARRFLNQTYERDAAARTIQTFFRRHVPCPEHHARRRAEEENRRRRRTKPSEEDKWRRTDFDRRRENATIRPSTPRHGGGHSGAEEEDDDQADLVWGRRRSSSLWSVSSDDSVVSHWSTPHEAASTHSTAPLSGSDVSLWSSRSSGEGGGGGGGAESGAYGGAEQVGGLPPQYEVFLWHRKQHALALAPCAATGFPRVADASAANVSLPGMWHVRGGDVLLSINDCSAHATELSLEEVEQVLDSGVRPAVLRFRRPSAAEIDRRERAHAEEARRRGRRRSPGGGEGGRAPSSSATIRRDVLRQRERAEASLCYVIWREEVPALGIRFQPSLDKPYPEVASVRAEGAAAGGGGAGLLSPGVQPGDWLLSVNDWGVRDAKFQHVLQVLHCSPRPLVLTFRRARRAPVASERTYEL